MRFLSILATGCLVAQTWALSIGGKQMVVERDSDGLQDIVTYDEHSLMVYGERIMVFSGEFHPYRLPVPDLWLDVFQKIKALGFSAVSFYVHWALLEGTPGNYTASGVFAFEPFFAAAQQAGIYLLARPGPYINAEASGGGFGKTAACYHHLRHCWLQRIKGQLRTPAQDYLDATDNYVAKIGATIARYQITNGGPIILVQPENEYTAALNPYGGFPNSYYFAYVKKQLRDAGIIVPFINNDAFAQGLFAPGDIVNGSTIGDVDIYGHDSYPLGFDCAHPTTWPITNLPLTFHATHEIQSPTTPYSLVEFQGGSFDPWGGLGFDQCAELLNMEFERVFYKNDFAAGATILNLYMIFGGTNWGNLGHPGGYTSYDYGASISENREIDREKYSELKLQGNFLKVTPAYLTASVGALLNGTYTNTKDISTTPLWGNGTNTNFYIVRHADYQQQSPTSYKLSLNTSSKGPLSIPQLGGSLTLSGRDSKWHVTDYHLGNTTLLYSTAEIFTWKDFSSKKVLVVYGGPGELHELAFITEQPAKTVEGTGITSKSTNGTTILHWETSSTRRVVQVGSLFVYILDRNTAYNYWTADFVRTDKLGAYSTSISKTQSVIVQAGYLIRNVYIEGTALHINGDINATVPIKVLGAPAATKSLHFNGQKLQFTSDKVTGEWTSSLKYSSPQLHLPDLSSLSWKYVDDLPEIQASYDDLLWVKADHTSTNNPTTLKTPTSLYASDYGFNAGVLIYRGHFTASGNESQLYLSTQGGSAFGSSVWLNSTYVGSWAGIDAASANNKTYTLPNLSAGKKYVITVLVDNNGLEENWVPGTDTMKYPRGILNYNIDGSQSQVSWKLTGNLGGENYIDKVRGPLNEGGLYAERQGFTQPYPPNRNWQTGHPEQGINKAGVAFYQAELDLDFPTGYDVPLAFSFGNTTIDGAVADYRAQLWVNGYQFGKYTNNIGPQTNYPVPQGILNYHGKNWLAVEIWAQQANGAHLSNFSLVAGTPVLTSLKQPALVPIPSYSKRAGAY
ncbi:putative beta-galactosidase [Coleophoma crateriformis]|uniref:Beta-galactosidase n=1 Tax=Coleophoma crateriformis TaxID=565419 RepID=A0A3D8S3G4_9HELO|nr:putative beta-galactosidase [Coleophoma crateriformis]